MSDDVYDRQAAAAFRKIVELGYCWTESGWMLPQKDSMLEQLSRMQGELDRLRKPAETRTAAEMAPIIQRTSDAEPDGRKAGWTPERRAAAAERMRKTQEARKLVAYGVPKGGDVVPTALLQQQMRPPTDVPVQKPRTNSRGGTVVKVSDAALKQGFKP